MNDDEVISLIAEYIDKKVIISPTGRVSNRRKLAEKVFLMAKRLRSVRRDDSDQEAA